MITLALSLKGAALGCARGVGSGVNDCRLLDDLEREREGDMKKKKHVSKRAKSGTANKL
jgi:hypothetical protein